MNAIKTTVITITLGISILCLGCELIHEQGEAETIIGTWKWDYSVGGWGMVYSPESSGRSEWRRYYRDSTFIIIRNDTLFASGRFSSYSTPSTKVIRYEDGLGLLDNAIRFAGPDTLVLAEPCCDRSTHYFSRR